MTRKDYEIIANTLNSLAPQSLVSNPETVTRDNVIRVLGELCLQLKEDNKRFDRIRFLNVCGLTANEIEDVCEVMDW